MVLGCCGTNEGQRNVALPKSEQSKNGFIAGCLGKKGLGTTMLAGALVMVLFAALMAGGIFGGGNMYFAAALLAVASVPFFIASGVLFYSGRGNEVTVIHPVQNS